MHSSALTALFSLLILLVDRLFRHTQLDQACGIVVKDPRVFHPMSMPSQHSEVPASLANETKLEHEYTMVEPAYIVVWVNQEASLELFNCTR